MHYYETISWYDNGFHMGLAMGMGMGIPMLTCQKPVPMAVPVLNKHMTNTYLGVGIQIEEARCDILFFLFEFTLCHHDKHQVQKKKAPAAKQSLSQSQNKSATKSRVSSQASTAIRGSIATSSRGTSQQATVEPSEDDDDDDEVDHNGGTFDVNRDTIMEPVNSNLNSESEQDEDEESKLSETHPVIYLVSHHSDDQQKNLPRIGWHLSMPSSGLFLTLSMLKATVATSFNVPLRAVNKNRGGLEDSLIQVTRNQPVICVSMQGSVGLLRLLLPPTRQSI
jgi:hypothetical protein